MSILMVYRLLQFTAAAQCRHSYSTFMQVLHDIVSRHGLTDLDVKLRQNGWMCWVFALTYKCFHIIFAKCLSAWVSMYVCIYVCMTVTHWNAIISHTGTPYTCTYHLRVWRPLPFHCHVHGTHPHWSWKMASSARATSSEGRNRAAQKITKWLQ